MALRVSNEQMEELLDHLESHPILATGVGLGARSKETVDKQWEVLASKLNSFGTGSTRSGQRWKKYWADIKHKAKTRLARIRREASATGGGPSSNQILNEYDEKILKIIGTEAVYGDTEHRVPLITIIEPELESERVVSPVNLCPTEPSLTPEPVTPRLTPYTRKESPVKRPALRLMQKRRCIKSNARTSIDPEWIKELEERRVEAETKLANAALIMAEACRAQVEIARSQADITLSQSQIIGNLINLVNKQSNDIEALIKQKAGQNVNNDK